MNRAILLTALAALATGSLTAQTQQRGQGHAIFDRAQVQGVEPQYAAVQVPRQECGSQWINETRQAPGANGYGGVIIGGLAGGVIGNQIGKGHGREAATAVGAVIGAIAGDRIAGRNVAPYEYGEREVRTCRTVNDVQQQLTGYRVNYEYLGHRYTTFTREMPGRTLPVRVTVTPLEEREYDRRH